MVLLGPSGAGKSSLLRVLNLLEMPRSGQLQIAGNQFDFMQVPSKKSIRELRQNVGMVFQQYNLWPHLTVVQNLIKAPCRVLGLTKAKAMEHADKLLQRLRLTNFADRFPLCQEMQAECTFTNQAFDSLIPGLKFSHFDAVMAGMDITPERGKQVLFTKPYFSNSALFIALKGSLADGVALKGKKVGVQNSNTHQKYLADKHPEITTVPYDSYQNAIMELKNGRVDAIFGDTTVVNEWLKQYAGLAAVGDKVTDKDYFSTGLGIALGQKNTELQGKFNAALDKIKQDGTYAALYKK